MARVTITLSGPITRETRSDASGRFEIVGLPPGDYQLRAEAPGFAPIHQSIRIGPGEMPALSLTMTIASITKTIVTAAKGGERDIQSSPLAIAALPDEQLTRFDLRGVDQAAAMMPSVTFSQNGTFGQLTIRGIGTNAVNAGADPSSAVYLDGIYLGRPAMAFADFLDLERVEVLRGPQGTLYGRNALGGALNLVPKMPSDTFEATARVGAGNLGELRAEARVSGPILPNRVLGSFAVARGVRDGYVRDLDNPDHPLGADDLLAARGQLRFFIGRQSDLLLSMDLTDQNGTLLTFNKVLQEKPGFEIDNPDDLHEVRTSTPASSELRQSGVTARFTSAVTPSVTLVSLTGYRTLHNAFIVDADITENDVLITNNLERQHQFSEELTVSQQTDRARWVAGLFFFDEDDHQRILVDQPPSRTQVQLDPQVAVQSAALFGEATVALTPRLSGIAGLRYTRERKDIDNGGGRYRLDPPQTPLPNATYAYSDSIENEAWTPKAGLEMQLRPDTLAYVTATRGFKSGGFNLSSPQPTGGFAPEWAWSYEAGLKTEWSSRASLRAAVFQMVYENLQVQTPVGIGVFDIRNAAAATIRGIEIEAGASLPRGLRMGGHVSWLDATYDDYIAVGLGGVTGDVSGNRLNNAPEWSGRIWTEWTSGVGRTNQLTLTADATAQSTVYYTPFNDAIQQQKGYSLLAARANFGPSDGRWAINAYVRNLTDTKYIMATFGTAPTAFGGRPGAPRQFGVQYVVRR